jgi:diacylglycerol kinase family enzyme
MSEQLELSRPCTLMADGELLQDVTRLSVACLPGAVNCVVGPG